MKIVIRLVWLLILMVVFQNLAFAKQPVVITSADVPSTVGTIYEEKIFKNGVIPIDLGSAGEQQVWDFTGYNLPVTEIWEVILMETSPFSSNFAEANLVYKVTNDKDDTVTYNYVKLTETDLSELGQGKQKNGVTTLLVTPHLIDPKTSFPVTWGTAPWNSAPQYATTVQYGPLTIDVVPHDMSQYVIDAWGTVKTPMGDIDCIRVKQFHEIDVYLSSGELFWDNYEKDIIYSWVSPVYGFVVTVKSKLNETNENFSEAREITVMTSFTSTPVVSSEPFTLAKDYILYQNYPNPFNPMTTISYELPEPNYVKIQILNIRGEEVATIVDEKQQPGKHFIQWNAVNQPSGNYFYQVQLGKFTMRQKCTLVK